MLQSCSNFDLHSKKSMCIVQLCMKFGEKVNVSEKIKLNGLQISWVDEIKHLGNYINQSLSDKLDCQYKVSSFIHVLVVCGVNKLNANFGNLQTDVILDCLNHIVHSIVVKHGVLIL